ncbi:GH3 auxin-responsive promoter family protein [Chitinispirillales bacterium ANBcel5]|uniref:GH3 auxin-responsive promoter family protein n=1 Tax=Cellulosispirillum alkaliphilum TaxID=3039283 RepID=UPI002A51643C|nr:GH3 auxin-responsive promoter family protein [Chitinispirillales bacterium ANBcel5]
MTITEKPWFRKTLLTLAGRPCLKEFLKASKECKSAQDRILSKIITTSQGTAFGKDHKFSSIKNISDYREAVPVNNFEDHRPYVERMCKGESDILFPGKAIFYNTTSGTTAKPKVIPVSKDYFENAYSGLSKLWLYSCLLDNPTIYNGKSLSVVSSDIEGYVEDGTPYGSISGMVYKNIPNVLKSTYSAPYPVICIKDYLKKYYALVRFALAHNITIIIAASPSSVIRLHQTIMDEYEDLIKDIYDGTLRCDVAEQIDPSVRTEVLKTLTPDPKRGKKLEKLMEQHGDQLRPKHFWPNLALVNTWKQGNFAHFIPRLDGFFPDSTVIRAFGYQASEGRAGLVMHNSWDYSVIAGHIYHFEFIELEQRNQKNPDVLQAHEVEVGKRYYILFSNGSGLYRYDINDIVEIVGFYNQFPIFKFIQKGEGVTSLTGEKLSEEQVIKAVVETSKELLAKVSFYTMFCDEKNFCYKFFVEFKDTIDSTTKPSFITALDDKLRQFNPEYKDKRGTLRLLPPSLYELKENSYERFKETLIRYGMAREGQYKDVYLTKNQKVLQFLEKLQK